ncbi:hypothetical protein OPT61_g1932 [Boeremia exigua]|uniref:Uncharacterized protein n=1 Tax=Boeremia exigua TaxID=749465 RepID=A0ACC2INR5_9PLEO|nr:hypothetical protein OPT61_g1932 [Boeremia exigua]
MSGVEVAGLVLGAFPLLLAGLQFYAEGIEVKRRHGKYRAEIRSLLDDLKAENSLYRNNLATLLRGVVDAKDIDDFSADPGGKLWKAPDFDRKLRQRLGNSYEPYLHAIRKLQTTTNIFREQLKLGESGHVSDRVLRYCQIITDILWPQFSEPQAFKEHYKRLKFSLRKADYADLMNTIRYANTILDRLTFQNQYIEGQQLAREGSIPNFQNINDRAQGVFSTLSSGWTCLCRTDHSVSLRLEPRMEDDSSDSDDDEYSPRDQFHVLFQYGYRYTIAADKDPSPWTWDEAKIQVICEKHPTSSGNTACGLDSTRSVRFSTQTKKKKKSSLFSSTVIQPTKDLCSAIETLQKPHHTLQMPQRDVCLTLLENETTMLKYGLKIYPTKVLPQDLEHWSVSTLRSALQRGRRFRRRERVYLALILASSVLQLHATPWLDDDWSIDNIYFVERPGSTSYHEPFVSRRLGFREASVVSDRRARMIRNQPLFALGVALIELWYGESLSNLYESEDGEQHPKDTQSKLLTRFNTADRIADEIAHDAGAKYSDAVRRCIRCDFSLSVNSLRDVQFQKAVFQGVVTKLKESYDFMTQVN